MFMCKTTLPRAVILLAIIQSFCLALGQEEPLKIEKIKDYESYKAIMLDLSEFAKVAKTKLTPVTWWLGIDDKGIGRASEGLIQLIDFQNSSVRVRLQYGQFLDINTAQTAITFHVKNVAAVFDKKPWPDVRLTNQVDEAFFHTGFDSAAILFRVGKACVLVSCHADGAVAGQEKAIFFADRIIKRLRARKESKQPRTASSPSRSGQS